jgi:hypothetical protein
MNIFIPKFIDKLKNTNLTEVVFNFYLDQMKDPQWNEASEGTLQSFLPELIKTKLNNIIDEGYVDKGLTEKRDKIIEIIDKLNFIMTSESTLLPNGNPLGAHDGQISDAKYKYAKLKNFVSSYEFYSKYYEMVNFFKEATDNIEAIEGTSIAENIIITNDQLVEIVHYLVKDEKSKFLDEYNKSNETYNGVFSVELPESSTTYFDQIELYFDTVIKITTTPQYEEFGYDILTAPKFAKEIPIRYEIEEQDELLDDAEGKILNKIFVNKPFLDPSNLNYYKK